MHEWIIWLLIALVFVGLLLGIVCFLYTFFIIHKNFQYKMEKEYSDDDFTF